MNFVQERYRKPTAPPPHYLDFLDRAKEFVLQKGLPWDIALDELGKPLAGQDWDFRLLTNSHDRVAATLGGFAVNTEMQELAVASGWNSASLPVGPVLSNEVRDFVKALLVHRCMQGRVPRSTRHFGRVYKAFFSVLNKAPWELNTEDFDRFIGLGHKDRKVQDGLLGVAKVMNQNLLALACPISPAQRATKRWHALHESLVSRASSQKLPNKQALVELIRIVSHEQPETHRDLIRFAATKVLVFTGLRLNEVLMLPADCLRWEEHVDVVSGKPAGEVGGVSRSLHLRYFAEKQADGAADSLLEELMPVPELFQGVVADAIEQVRVATESLRRVLKEQHVSGRAPDKSDLRRFKVSGQQTLSTADLLFLQGGVGRDLKRPAISDDVVTVLGQNSLYLVLGCNKQKWKSSFFARYGRLSAEEMRFIRPHSLRHLLNTELFRLEVSDAVITQHFGRTSVAQSYEYDHRTLLEKFEHVTLPGSAAGRVKSGTPQELVAKLVVGGVVPKSHIALSFQKIQKSSGDEAAFRYLVANSDGFHTTPYGFCLNSFSLNPCARHLKCFDRCKHFAASGIEVHRVSLETLRTQLISARKCAADKPVNTVGRKNQLAHVDVLLAGIDAALSTQPNTSVFGGSVDHSDVSKGDLLS